MKRHKPLLAISVENVPHDCSWLLILAAALLLGVVVLRRIFEIAFGPIEAYERRNRAVGLSVESGRGTTSLWDAGNLFTSRGASALAALAMLRKLSERTSLSDCPPVVTSGDALLAILSQDTLQSAYRRQP